MIENRSNRDLLCYIIYVCFRRKYLILITFVTTFMGFIFGAYIMQPTWKATVKILAQYNPNLQITFFKDLSSTYSDVGSKVKVGSNLVAMLTSRSIAEDTVKRFKLDERLRQRTETPAAPRDAITNFFHYIFLDLPFKPFVKIGLLAESKKNYLSDAIDDLVDHWEDIAQGDDNEVVNLTIWGHTPKLATDVANAMAEVVILKTLEMSLQEANEAYDFLSRQLPIVEANLNSAEDTLKRFKEENNTVQLLQEQDVNIKRIDTINAEIIELQSKLASALVEKKEEHPEVKELKMQKRKKMNQLRREKRKSKIFAGKELELNRLTRIRDISESVYKNLKSQFDEIKILKDSAMNEMKLKIIDQAYVPDDHDPDWPAWKFYVPAILIVSVIFAFVAGFSVEYWNDTKIRTVGEVADILNLPVISIIPNIRKFGLTGKNVLPVKKRQERT